MKILLAGMQYLPNQFSRAIEKLGCEVVHTNGDPGAFPRWCDAAVIAKTQIGHRKYLDVKNDYSTQGKVVFVCDHSFSTIKERFEEFVAEFSMKQDTAMIKFEKKHPQLFEKIVKGPNTVLGKAFEKAEINIVVAPKTYEQPVHPAEEVKTVKPGKSKENYNFGKSYEPGVKEKIMELIVDCQEADMSAQETADMLKAHNFKKTNGDDFNTFDVYNLRSELKKKIEKAKAIAKAKRAEKAAAAPPKQEPKPFSFDSPLPPKKYSELDLFNRVLDMRLDPAKTIEFQNWLRTGKLNINQAVWFLDIIETMKKKGE